MPVEGNTVYLLLTLHKLPDGGLESNWQVFGALDIAQDRRKRLRQESEGAIVGYCHQIGPVLVQSIILEMKEVG